jgi:uncharacterized protein involved in exopolysaccharide biosynthesis
MRDVNSEYSTNDNSRTISIRGIIAPLFRRKRVLIVTFLIAFIAVIVAGILMPPQFTSQMVILVNRERLDPLVTTGSATQNITVGDPVSDEEINSEAALLKSRDVLEKVVLANGLQMQNGGTFSNFLHPNQNQADRVERAVRSLAKNIQVSSAEKTDLIQVTYSSSNPRLAYGVLAALGRFYLEKHVAIRRPPGSYEFFAQQTQKYQNALQASERSLRSFEEQPDSAAPDLERTNLALQVTNSIGQMHLSEESIAGDEQRLRSDRQQIRVTPERSATTRATDSASLLLQSLGTSLLTAETKRTQLLLKYDPKYPLVKEADQEVAEAKAAIAQAEKMPYINEETDRDPTFELLREDLVKTESDLAAQRADLAAIKASIQSLQSQMSDLDQKAVTQQDLLRNVKTNEESYLLYLSKRDQEETSDALDKTRIANVAIAVPPAVPALPARGFPSVVMLALILAVVLSISAAYIVDYFDSSFHTPAEVTDYLGIPLVVAVSKRAA